MPGKSLTMEQALIILVTGGLHWTIRDFRPSTEWKTRGPLRVGGVEEPEKFYRVIKQFVRGT